MSLGENVDKVDFPYYHRLYRELHQDPELGRGEERTALRIAEALQRLPGVSVKTSIGGHGVVGIFSNGPGPTIMLRAELDALPVLEESGFEFASQKRMIDPVDGLEKPVMHACGHDLHSCAQLVAAESLLASQGQWKGTLLLLFQPDEESGRGAQTMVDDGLYDEAKHAIPKPNFVLGGHSMPMRAGCVATRPGVINSATCGLHVTLYGRGGHGARPHTTVDPVILACSIVMKLQTIVSRLVNPLDPVVVTVGSIHAGSAANVISDHAELQINIRALTQKSFDAARDAVFHIVRSECASMGSPKEPVFEEVSGFPLLLNDAVTTADVTSAFVRRFGDQYFEAPISMGAEDMANLATPVDAKCCFWTFGCIDPEVWDRVEAGQLPAGQIAGNHSARFAPCLEPSLKVAAECYTIAALQCFSSGTGRD